MGDLAQHLQARGVVRPVQLLLVALSMAYAAGLVHSPLLTTLVFVCVGLLFWGVASAPTRLLALLLGLATAWRAQHEEQDYLARRQRWIAVHGARATCSGTGIIASSPTVHREHVVTIVNATALDCATNGPEVPARLRLTTDGSVLARGDQVEFIAELGPVAMLQNNDVFSPLPRMVSANVVASGTASLLERRVAGHGISSYIDRLRNHVRRRIIDTYAPRAEALGRALVLGENDLDPDDDAAFRRSGLSHLLAVSGTHLVFAIVAWMTALKALLRRLACVAGRCDVNRWIAPLGAMSALVYADFAGGSGSAWRAAWMLCALYCGRLLARRVHATQALALSLVVAAIIDPWLGFDVSFMLSAAATVGLVTLSHRVVPLLNRLPTRALRFTGAACCTTVCAMLPCIPILSLLAPDVTVAGMFANVIAGPLGEAASLPLCLVHAIASVVPSVERGLALCASGSLLLVAQIAKTTAAITWARVGVPYLSSTHFCVLLVTAWAVALGRKGAPRWVLLGVGALAFAVVEYAARGYGCPRSNLRVTINDVGQGDSILVDFPDGRCMLIDGGGNITGGADPGVTVLQPLLRARRRRKLDVVVISHPHPDHFGGLISLLPGIEIGEVWMQEGTLPDLQGALQRRNVPIVGLCQLCGKSQSFGAARVRVLGPCPDASHASNVNNASIVIQVRLGERAVLLQGDAEHEAEHELVQRFGSQLRSDLLKVGHHGSRSSTSPEWLRAVHPTWAAISVGARNRFGHPVPATEQRLTDSGAVVLRTDELGSIQWQTDGHTVRLRTARTRVDLGN